MALAPIAPWLQSADALGAARAGATLGLQRRQQDLSQLETAQRMALAYAQMQEESQREAARNDMRQQVAAMQLEEKQREAQMRAEQNAALLGLRSDQLSQQGAHQAAMQQSAAERLALQQQLGTSRLASENEKLQLSREALDQRIWNQAQLRALGADNLLLRQQAFAAAPRRMTPDEEVEKEALMATYRDSLLTARNAVSDKEKAAAANALKSSRDALRQFNAKLLSVPKVPGAGPAAGTTLQTAPAGNYPSPEAVRAAFMAGQIPDAETAKQILMQQFGYEE